MSSSAANPGASLPATHLAGLFIHPVKSLRGCAVESCGVDALGPVGDRRFLVVDADGRFLTQRTRPRMALIGTRLDPTRLTLSAPGRTDLTVGRAPDPAAPRRQVTVWKHEGLAAEDCGPEAAAWLADFLGTDCALVRLGPDHERAVLKPAARPGDSVAFADACPFLLLGEATLADLNDRLLARGEEPVPLDRFRANLIVRGSPAGAEDRWTTLRIGGIAFRSAGPCARCVVTTTDQVTALRGPEPLRTLAEYRRDPRDPTLVNFGINLIHATKSGVLRVGDPVEITS
jgi:uncharacterized protein YcbX